MSKLFTPFIPTLPDTIYNFKCLLYINYWSYCITYVRINGYLFFVVDDLITDSVSIIFFLMFFFVIVRYPMRSCCWREANQNQSTLIHWIYSCIFRIVFWMGVFSQIFHQLRTNISSSSRVPVLREYTHWC